MGIQAAKQPVEPESYDEVSTNPALKAELQRQCLFIYRSHKIPAL